MTEPDTYEVAWDHGQQKLAMTVPASDLIVFLGVLILNGVFRFEAKRTTPEMGG